MAAPCTACCSRSVLVYFAAQSAQCSNHCCPRDTVPCVVLLLCSVSIAAHPEFHIYAAARTSTTLQAGDTHSVQVWTALGLQAGQLAPGASDLPMQQQGLQLMRLPSMPGSSSVIAPHVCAAKLSSCGFSMAAQAQHRRLVAAWQANN